MKLYAVVFNTYDEDYYGAEMELFGVYDTKEKAIERIEYLRKNEEKDIYVLEEDSPYGIKEIMLNEDCREYLGGYIE